jgi:hypothetical protein
MVIERERERERERENEYTGWRFMEKNKYFIPLSVQASV